MGGEGSKYFFIFTELNGNPRGRDSDSRIVGEETARAT